MSAEMERLRMCVAEAGYSEDLICCRSGVPFFRRTLPPSVAWRAREVSGHNEPTCWECWNRRELDPSVRLSMVVPGCEAPLRLMLDCGRRR